MITHAVDSSNVTEKAQKWGCRQAAKVPTEVSVRNERYLDGAVNVYEDIYQYMLIRDRLYVENDRFFLGINRKAATPYELFRGQAVSCNTFWNIVKMGLALPDASFSVTVNL